MKFRHHWEKRRFTILKDGRETVLKVIGIVREEISETKILKITTEAIEIHVRAAEEKIALVRK